MCVEDLLSFRWEQHILKIPIFYGTVEIITKYSIIPVDTKKKMYLKWRHIQMTPPPKTSARIHVVRPAYVRWPSHILTWHLCVSACVRDCHVITLNPSKFWLHKSRINFSAVNLWIRNTLVSNKLKGTWEIFWIFMRTSSYGFNMSQSYSIKGLPCDTQTSTHCSSYCYYFIYLSICSIFDSMTL